MSYNNTTFFTSTNNSFFPYNNPCRHLHEGRTRPSL